MHSLKIGAEKRGQPVSALIYLFTNMSVFLFIDKEEQKIKVICRVIPRTEKYWTQVFTKALTLNLNLHINSGP